MGRWLEFMGNHPVLFGLLAILAVIFFITENLRSGKKVSPSALGLMVNNDHAVLIDIRATKKFEAGHIVGSRNIPFTELKDKLSELQAITTPIIVICDMGMQAGAAVQLIAKPNVYRLDGGISNWQASGMPLITPKKPTNTNKSKK